MTQNNRPAQGGRSTGARAAARQARASAATGQAKAPAVRQRARRPQPKAAPVARQPQQRSFSLPESPLGGYFSGSLLLLLLMSAAAIVLGVVLQNRLPDGFVLRENREYEVPRAQAVSEIHSDGPLRLNEIMTSNGGTLVDVNGKTPDWVEVTNLSGGPVSLEGYILARSAKAGNVFAFPAMTLGAGECAVVFCDGELQAVAGEELHAPFRLSSGGDVLMLFNQAEVAVDTVNIPALGSNTAYVRRDRDHWESDTKATPGLANTAENYAMMNTVRGGSSVVLAEVVASNTKYRADENGVYQDYVLLRNNAGSDADLSGWYLSDDPSIPRKWRFPDGATVAAGGTLVVFCSGSDSAGSPSKPHASFRLSTEGETITLSDASGQPVDQMTYDLLRPDTACLRGSDGSWTVGEPTK